MISTFTLQTGNMPVLISFPHVGTYLPPSISFRLTPVGKRVVDTDWHVDRLYNFAIDLGITTIRASISRYVADLNRDPSDAALYANARTSAVCPTTTFEGEPLYAAGDEPMAGEISERLETYWQPYHDALQSELWRLRKAHGYVILLDAHSIWGRLPLLFNGELPDVNIGTNDGVSCDLELVRQAVLAVAPSPYSVVVDDRFRGGYITRHYGRPVDNVHALQIELNQRTYLVDGFRSEFDSAKATNVMRTLKTVTLALLTCQPKVRSPRGR